MNPITEEDQRAIEAIVHRYGVRPVVNAIAKYCEWMASESLTTTDNIGPDDLKTAANSLRGPMY